MTRASSRDNREVAVVDIAAAGDIAAAAEGIAAAAEGIADTAEATDIVGAANLGVAPFEVTLAVAHSRQRHGIFQTLLCRFGITRRDRLRASRRWGDRRRHRCWRPSPDGIA